MAVLSQSTSSVATPGSYSNHRSRNPRRNYFPITTSASPSAIAPVALKASAFNSRRNGSDRYKPLIQFPPILKKNLLTAALYGAGANLLFLLLQGGGGGSNNAGSIVRGGGGGGGAGKSGDFLSRLFSLQGIDKEEKKSEQVVYRVGSPVYMLGRLKKYTLSDVLFFDRRLAAFTDPTEDPLFKSVTLLPGQVYTRAQLQKELENLAGSGLFEEVDFDCKKNRDGTLRIRISFLERTWQQPAEKIRCINVGTIAKWNPAIEIPGKEGKNPGRTGKKNILEYIKDGIEAEYSKRMEMTSARPCLLPVAVQEEISDRLRRKNAGGMSARLLVKVRERVQQWYAQNGYPCAQVVSFGKLNTEELVCEVAEGDITRIDFGEKSMNDVPVPDRDAEEYADQLAAVVERVLPHGLRRGEVFNSEAAEQAKFSIDSLGPFSNTEIDLGLDEENGGGVIVKFKLEKKRKDSGEYVSLKDSPLGYDD